MAIMYITEYARKAQDERGHELEAGEEPALAIQAVTFTGTAGQSAALNAATTFVRVFCDGDACLLFGESPTATNQQDTAVNAEAAEYFGVKKGSTLKISAVTRT